MAKDDVRGGELVPPSAVLSDVVVPNHTLAAHRAGPCIFQEARVSTNVAQSQREWYSRSAVVLGELHALFDGVAQEDVSIFDPHWSLNSPQRARSTQSLRDWNVPIHGALDHRCEQVRIMTPPPERNYFVLFDNDYDHRVLDMEARGANRPLRSKDVRLNQTFHDGNEESLDLLELTGSQDPIMDTTVTGMSSPYLSALERIFARSLRLAC